MYGSNTKLIYLLWTVIVVLIIGLGAGGYFMYHHLSEVDESNVRLHGDNDSLRRQLQQAKAAPKPTATPEPTLAPTPSPVPTATPKAKP
jgi:hypothetical protein